MRFLIFCLLFFAKTLANAQPPEDFLYENKIYRDNIRTVKLHTRGSPTSMPIVNLNASQATLLLTFDVMDGELNDFMYTIVHCTADWQPSKLENNQYLDGFSEDRVQNGEAALNNPGNFESVETSLNTLQNYVNYKIALPNRNMGWTISGNYLLIVWDVEAEEVVLTRRFMVVEPSWRVEARFVQPAKVEKIDTHHEIDFTVKHEGTRIALPMTEVKAVVQQNGRWDNAIGLLPPFAALGQELSFNFQDRVVFPAGKEFRFFDIQQLESPGRNVEQIVRKRDFYEVTLRTERNYSNQVFQQWGDLDGKFSIENTQFPGDLRRCEYAKVLFSLAQPIEVEDSDVYVFGELSDWQIKPEFRMEYSEAARVYYVETWLKQGFYNYEIVKYNPKTGKIDDESFNGNSFLTGNSYTILIYYKPYGGLYDRLMVASTFKSLQRN